MSPGYCYLYRLLVGFSFEVDECPVICVVLVAPVTLISGAGSSGVIGFSLQETASTTAMNTPKISFEILNFN